VQTRIQIANPPAKPLMVYDGDCNFCGLWIRRWRQLTGDAVDYLPSRDPRIAEQYPEIPREYFQTSVQLVERDGTVLSGAEAVFRALAKNPKLKWPLKFYESSGVFATVTERAYQFVASHRTGFSFLTRLAWGRHVERPEYYATCWIFLRALGLVYLVAFVSLWTQVLGLLLLDDFVLKKLAPGYLTHHAPRATRPHRLLAITIPLAIIFISVSFLEVAAIFGVGEGGVLKPVASIAGWLEPFRSFNGYGLFAVMTTERNEIIVQGSNDSVHWSDYEFKYKPDDVNRRPVFIAPFQPRLDWQMWFAALSDYRNNQWFENFCVRLLQGSPPVLALLRHNPFPEKPPRYIRAEFYNYQFTNFAERRATGAWWKRQSIGEYLPPISLSQSQR
jgi:predicted DCC family thiol-disulfide oxidoreductase YuxK